ncbi:MAG: hypothetical protein KIS94_11485 [Chitinophagales bacterium]|nr:hypothetical protein [Chitinophagales bacterium]
MMRTILSDVVRSVAVLLVITVGFASCKKEPGTGGLATIRGKVKGYDVNILGDKVDSAYIPDLRVFISYGKNTWVDNDTRTSYTGEFAFEWLQKGDYTIWVVHDCNNCPYDKKADTLKVTINKRRETVITRDLIYYY